MLQLWTKSTSPITKATPDHQDTQEDIRSPGRSFNQCSIGKESPRIYVSMIMGASESMSERDRQHNRSSSMELSLLLTQKFSEKLMNAQLKKSSPCSRNAPIRIQQL
jgi:hypothetical protein